MLDDFIWTVRVYYEDTDAAGVVFYANYLRFMERARTEWMRTLGFDHHQLADDRGILFAVRSITINYHRPAKLDDLIEIRSRIIRKRGASICFEQTLTRNEGEIICTAEVKVACLNVETLKPEPLPEHFFGGDK